MPTDGADVTFGFDAITNSTVAPMVIASVALDGANQVVLAEAFVVDIHNSTLRWHLSGAKEGSRFEGVRLNYATMVGFTHSPPTSASSRRHPAPALTEARSSASWA